MKGGKDEEKIVGPLFPRLHVNDTEKGGPRAPPRNKMALYEQLSIPSQRFNQGLSSTSSLPSNNTSNLVTPASSTQGGGLERGMLSPFYVPSTSTHSAEKLHSQPSDGSKFNNTVSEIEQKSLKISGYQTSNGRGHILSTAECSSFHPRASPCQNEEQRNMCKEKFIPFSNQCSSTVDRWSSELKTAGATCISSLHVQNSCEKQLKQAGTVDLKSRQHIRNQSEQKIKESLIAGDSSKRPTSQPLPREKTAETFRHGDSSSNNEHRSSPFNALGKSHDTDVQLHQDYIAVLLPENTVCTDGVSIASVRGGEKENSFGMRTESSFTASLGDEYGRSNGIKNGNMHCEGEGNGSLQEEDVDGNDDASETSMVDSLLGLDISPDDVVGVIGHKQFWKARKAIADQQRVFAVQVFELHRLIKVQKSIASSPNLLLEDHPCFEKPSPKASPVKLQSEHVPRKPSQIFKQKDDSHQPNQNIECATENTVGKPRLPYLSNGINKGLVNQHSSYGPFSVSQPPATPLATDKNVGSWFYPPPGNQWLVPLISPSEGLVYKPYTGPFPPTAGFMAPVYGGCGSLSLPAVAGDFLNPPYGVPAADQHGTGVLPDPPPVGQTYFSPHGMPVMNPPISSETIERMRLYTGARPHSQADRTSTGEVNMNMNYQRSCNISSRKSGTILCRAEKVHPSKESEMQGSTASSPSERARGSGTGNINGGRDALPLFPMAPAMQVSDQSPKTRSRDDQSRVIRVVPHNPRSATESAARIFQSIQEERKQYDTV